MGSGGQRQQIKDKNVAGWEGGSEPLAREGNQLSQVQEKRLEGNSEGRQVAGSRQCISKGPAETPFQHW